MKQGTNLDDIMLESILADDAYIHFKITEHYQLTENEIRLVVKEWYLNYYLPKGIGVIQDEYGGDLEELVDLDWY